MIIIARPANWTDTASTPVDNEHMDIAQSFAEHAANEIMHEMPTIIQAITPDMQIVCTGITAKCQNNNGTGDCKGIFTRVSFNTHTHYNINKARQFDDELIENAQQ
jgi:hypothetical protein